jgi:hypothetical protein
MSDWPKDEEGVLFFRTRQVAEAAAAKCNAARLEPGVIMTANSTSRVLSAESCTNTTDQDDRHVKKLVHALCLAATLIACETPLRSAPATAQVAPRLPNTIFGHYWCFSRAPDGDPVQNASLLTSADNFDDCANHGGVRFWRRGGKSGY